MNPPMVADVGVFQVAGAPMYGYVYTLTGKCSIKGVGRMGYLAGHLAEWLCDAHPAVTYNKY